MLFKVKLIILSLMVGAVLPSTMLLLCSTQDQGRPWQNRRTDSPVVWVYLIPTVQSEPCCILYIHIYKIDRYYQYVNFWERCMKKKKVSKWNTDGSSYQPFHSIKALMLFMCRKERGLSSPRTRQRSPTSVSGRLHPAGIPRCSPDWMQLQFQFPQTAVGNLTELVQSTLL